MFNKNVDYNTIRIDVKSQVSSTQGQKVICEDEINYVRRKVFFICKFALTNIIVVTLYFKAYIFNYLKATGANLMYQHL